MNISEIVYLDLNQVELYGWETEKSDLVIDSLVRGIEAGDEFPEVNVIMINERTFQLDPSALHPNPKIRRADGGHKRAVAHYITNKPLKCKITRRFRQLTEDKNIRDIILVDDDKYLSLRYEQIKARDHHYR